MELLDDIQAFVNEANMSNSTIDKQIIVRKYAHLKELFKWVYSPYTKFYVTSKAILDRPDLTKNYSYTSLYYLLEELNKRIITGHEAIASVNAFIERHIEHKELILNIIDKNLKTRTDAKVINKALPGCVPQFNVALANKYSDHAHKVNLEKDTWFCSRKLDGLRCIAIPTAEGYKLYSRSGKEFLTLDKVKTALNNGGYNRVFDGEICIVDENGNEDFTSIMKEYSRKNHTIEKPMYKIFDCLKVEDFENGISFESFSDRTSVLTNLSDNFDKNHLNQVEQVKVKYKEFIDEQMIVAIKNGWEGLILRKNTNYKGKRSNDLLKVKQMHDAEYTIERIEVGYMRYIKDGFEAEDVMLTTAFIMHKGFEVGVGSGFTIEQRIYYAEHQEELIGKVCTIRYFEETKNQNGGLSLRFPIIKYIHEGERNV